MNRNKTAVKSTTPGLTPSDGPVLPGRLLLRVDEAANALGVSRAFLYQLLASDPSLPVVRMGRAVRIPAAALAQWAATKEESWAGGP